jgi:hypothetical protein
MIVSLSLLLVAVVLAVVGVAQGSGPLLVGSILASLLTAITLVASARHAAATRLAVGRDGLVVPLLPGRDDERPGGAEDRFGRADDLSEPVTAVIPAQHRPGDRDTGPVPTTPGAGADDTQAFGVRAAAPSEQWADANDDPPDEPPIQVVTPEHAAVVAGLATNVVVVDERPRYHLSTCVHLIDRELAVLPVREAVELGFTPCAMCEPDTALLAQAQRSG